MNRPGIKFKNYLCFTDKYAGFDELKHINVVIGKNNSGKSRLLDVLKGRAALKENQVAWRYSYSTSGDGLLAILKSNSTINASSIESFLKSLKVVDLEWTYWNGMFDVFPISTSVNVADEDQKYSKLRDLFGGRLKFKVEEFELGPIIMVGAERNIIPESHSYLEKRRWSKAFRPDGSGLTNVMQNIMRKHYEGIRRFKERLLQLINGIVKDNFVIIDIDVHQLEDDSGIEGRWEIFVDNSNGIRIPLSRSGSGLKTVLHTVLALHLDELLGIHKPEKQVYCFEELENNLHPSLLRRLLKHIEEFALKHDVPIFFTTHSPVLLDAFAGAPHAQFVLVQHDGTRATTKTVTDHFGKLEVVQELGCKASDLMLANGIIWVEGPSDRIYVNKWIELYAGGVFREGRDYQCAFYGGALLTRTQCAEPECQDQDKTNFMPVNPNMMVICDGDRTSKTGKGAQLKTHVQRMEQELKQLGSTHFWATQAKEIESYIPVSVLKTIWKKEELPPIGQYEPFFLPQGKSRKASYAVTHLALPKGKRKSEGEPAYCRAHTLDKVSLALDVASRLTSTAELESLFDWKKHMTKVCETLAAWNQMSWPPESLS